MDRFRLPVLNVLVFCIFSSAQSVGAQAGGPAQGNFEELTLELSTTKAQFRLLEPIPIVLTLANRTEHVINGHPALDFGLNYLELYVERAQGQLKKINRLSTVKALFLAKHKAMKPGAEFSTRQLLTLKLDQIFPEPGTYRIEARLFDIDHKTSIRSKPLAIQIVPATGVDFQALEFIRTYGDPSDFLTGTRIDRNLHLMETFASAFGESAYSDYVTFNIAQYLLVNRDFEKSLKHFEKLAKKRDFIFSDKASDYIVKIKRLKEPEP